jgi:pimeloyl-ACP methyl ester carboxylesterase
MPDRATISADFHKGSNVRFLLSTLVLIMAVAGMLGLVLNSGWLELSLDELERRYATTDSRFADIDGVRMHYMDQGSGEPVLLLHASFMNLRTWDSLADALASEHRVVRPDVLIAGLTGPEPNGEYSFNRNLELVLGLMDQLQIPRFSVIATSSGGIVAYRMAAQHPERVERLVLVNSAGLPRTARTNPNRARLRGGIRNWIRERYQSPANVQGALDQNFIEPHEPPKWLVDMNYDMWRREGRREAGAAQLKNFRTGDPQAMLAKITAPTMILWGLDNRTVVHLEADVFQHWLTSAPTLVKKYPGVGHYLYLEIPDEFERDVEAFLKGELDGELTRQQRVPYSSAGIDSGESAAGMSAS